MASIASPLSPPAPEAFLARTRHALGPEGVGLALCIVAAFCLVMAALALGDTRTSIPVDPPMLTGP